jgi:calcineurin-like phosphoesterase family protein
MIKGLYKIFDRWHEVGTLWIYSDPHFGDEELAKAFPNRPTAEEQVKMINKCAGKHDTLIILGDVGDVSYVRKLRAGYKILIMGNHDAGITNYQKKRMVGVYSKDGWEQEEATKDMMAKYPECNYFTRESLVLNSWEVSAKDPLFDEVYEGPVMIAEKLILSHEPVDIPWAFNIHGHCHNKERENDSHHLNVCADAINYQPVNMNQFMKSGALNKIETLHRATIDKATRKKHG